jgi:hypothetical protein
MFRLVRQRVKRRIEGVWLIITSQPVVSFSWMHYIVIYEKDWVDNGEDILAHEMAHIKNGHSIDLLLVEACILLHWFNPAVWLLRQELQHVHEYEADESVIQKGIDAKKYQLLLIKKAVGTQRFTSVANSFNHSSLKKRIAMMLKRKSHPWARLKYLYILPLAACAIVAFARPEISHKLEKISSAKLSEIVMDMQALPDTIFVKEDSVALEEEFEEMIFKEKTEINENIAIIDSEIIAEVRVEQEKVKPEIERAREYIRSEEVQKAIREGMEKAKPEIERAMEYIRSEEVQKAIHEGMEKAKPEIERAMEYIRSEEMQKAIREGMEKAKPEIEQVIAKRGIENPLILLDGKEITREEMNKIPSTDIESITILKDKTTLEKYGEKAVDSVIEFRLKKK